MADPPVRAVVQKIVRERRRTPYAVAIREDDGSSLTFTLQKRVWREKDDPSPSDVVLLSNFRRTEGGWRAMCGRFLQPSDEQPAISKQERSK